MYMSVSDAVDELHVSRWTVTRLIEDGEIAAVKIGSHRGAPLRIDRASFAAYVARNTVSFRDPNLEPEMTATAIPELIKLDTVAERTGLSLRFLEDGCRAKRLEHVHIGRNRYMTEQQIAKLVEQNTVTPARSAEDPDLEADRRRAERAIARGAMPTQRRGTAA